MRLGITRRCALPAALLCMLVLAACGGNGGAAGPAVDPPTNLTYADPNPTYRTDAPIAANNPSTQGGAPTAFSVAPALPAGLALNPATGVISGTPLVAAAPTPYTFSAANAGGATNLVVTLEVEWATFKSIEPHTGHTDADLRHFLKRTNFGYEVGRHTEITSNGFDTYLDGILDMTPNVALEDAARQAHLVDPGDPNGEEPTQADLAQWHIYLIQNNPNAFQEVLCMHWHDHFAASTSVLDGFNSRFFVDQINLWRHSGAGNLRQLLIDMARDAAMLIWLNGIDNVASTPNENFSREYFELYCFGVGNGYTEGDIQEAARALTGYRYQFNVNTQLVEVKFNPFFHDATDKTVLGTLIQGQNSTDDYEALVDITLAQLDPANNIPRAALWIARQTLRRFVMDAPDDALVEQLATVLAANWDLTEMLRTMFRSEAFFSSAAKAGFVKTPVEHVMGFIRSTQITWAPETLDFFFTFMGNRPTQPPTVDGWPEGKSWLSAQGMVDRGNTLRFLISDRQYQTDNGVDLAQLLAPPTPPATKPTAEEVLDFLANRLSVTLAPTEHTQMLDYMNTDRLGGVVVPDPFDADNLVHLDQRVRGVLYMLGQHPSYVLR